MKAVVVEIKDSFAAVLLDDGRVIRIKNVNYDIGEVIDMKKTISGKKNKLVALAATAAIFIMMLGVGAWAYVSPDCYVNLDVNPSIEFTVNWFERVIDVQALNDDGTFLLEQLDVNKLKNQNIGRAIAQTVDEIIAQGYFEEVNTGVITVIASGKNPGKAEGLVQRLQDIIESKNQENRNVVEVVAESAGLDRVQQAKDLGVTPGKLRLVELLQDSSEDPIDVDYWIEQPVKDIMQAFAENKRAKGLENSENRSENAADKEQNSENKADNALDREQNSESKSDNAVDIEVPPISPRQD